MLRKIKAGIKRLFIVLKLGWLWNLFRPAQVQIYKLLFRKGLKKNIGDIAKIYLCHDCWDADMPAPWELAWWKRLMQEIRPGDTIVDVGAYIGIFTVVLAKMTEAGGKVLAFEPNPKAAALFKKNISLNGVSGQVDFFDLAIGRDPRPLILTDNGSISRIIPATTPASGDCLSVKSGSLDRILGNRKIDLLKIDVEGYEANVLYGAVNLLKREEGYPRFILIECHPHLWKDLGVKSQDLMAFLRDAGYAVEMPKLKEGQELDKLNHHWVIFAAKKTSV